MHTYAARSYITEMRPKVMLVLSGRIAVYGFGVGAGDRHLIRVLGPGAELGLSAVFQERLRSEFELVVKKPCTLVSFDTMALRQMWKSGAYPAFTANVTARLGEICQDLVQRVAILSCYEITDRIRLRERYATQDPARYPELAGMAELAEWLSVGRTALYRTLGRADTSNVSHVRQL